MGRIREDQVLMSQIEQGGIAYRAFFVEYRSR
jgi:hypothetical protein